MSAGNLATSYGGYMARRRYQKGTLLKRGGSWVGRWLEDMVQPDGSVKRKHRSRVLCPLSFSEREAQRELDKCVEHVNDPAYRPAVEATFGQFAVKWQDMILVPANYKPSNITVYRCIIKRYLLPAFGLLPLRALNTELLQRFIQGRSGLSPKYVKNIILVLRSMWKSAQGWGYVSHNPFDYITLPKQQPCEARHFTIEEVQRIIAAASEPLSTLYWLAAETGLRAGELCGLRWADVDCIAGVVQVRQSVWRGQVQCPKTRAGERRFCISQALAGHLRTLRIERGDDGVLLVFRSRRNTPLNPDLLVKRKLRPLCVRLGIEPGGLHAFRHFNGSIMDEIGVPMKVRQKRLGHANAETTLGIYTHAVDETDRQVAQRIGALVAGKESQVVALSLPTQICSAA